MNTVFEVNTNKKYIRIGAGADWNTAFTAVATYAPGYRIKGTAKINALLIDKTIDSSPFHLGEVLTKSEIAHPGCISI